MWLADIIMLISDIICCERQVSVYLEICAQIITGLYKSVKPIRFCSDVGGHRSIGNKVIDLEPVPHSRRNLAGLHMMTELNPVSEGESEIGCFPVKGHIRNISQIEAGIE
jgi:hypothetical protein